MATTRLGSRSTPMRPWRVSRSPQAVHYDVGQLTATIERFDDYVDEKLWQSVSPSSVRPPAFRSRVPFFSPNVESQVLTCLDFINEETTGWIKDLFQTGIRIGHGQLLQLLL